MRWLNWGNRTCCWWQRGWGGREPQQLGFGARVLWLRVSRFFWLIIWPCVALQLLNMGFLQLFPSAVVELLHAALSSEGPCNFCSAVLLKRDLEPVVCGGRCVLPSFLGGWKRDSVLDRSAVLKQCEGAVGMENIARLPASAFLTPFGILFPVHGLQHNLLFRVRFNWNQLLIKFMSKLINHNYSDHVHMNNFYYGEHNY